MADLVEWTGMSDQPKHSVLASGDFLSVHLEGQNAHDLLDSLRILARDSASRPENMAAVLYHPF